MGHVIRDNQKVFIQNVRKVSWDTGEMSEFASCLVAALQSLGETVSYDEVMCTSGTAFRFTINPGEWDFGNYSFRNIAANPDEPTRRAFAAQGYACSIYQRGTFEEDSARIMDSINRGVPVLAHHIVGPSDCTIITGYDEGGQVLMGWSTYMDIPDDHNIPHDSTGYFHKPGWHDNCDGYILIGEKVGKPEPRELLLNTLRWGVELLKQPAIDTKVTGLAGLRAWAAEMTADENFPLGDNELIGWRYVSVTIQITMLRDHCRVAPYLRQAAVEFPEMKFELQQAAECYAQVASLRDQMDSLIPDNFAPGAADGLKSQQTRLAFASLILRIRNTENGALQHLERLLKRF